MLKAGEAHAAPSLEVVVEIAPQRAAKSSDEGEEPSVGTVLQEDSMKLVVELDTAGDVAPGLFQAPDDIGEPVQSRRIWRGRLVERERLEGGENGPDLTELGPIEGGQAESPAGLRGKQPFTGEAQECFPHRGPADPELAGDGGIADSGPAGDRSLLNALQDLKIDLLPEWRSRNGMRHTVFRV
jgi:hypothetical protein